VRERTYVVSDDLPELGGEARAYRLDRSVGPRRARFDELRAVFGVGGEVDEYAPGDLQAIDDDLVLVVTGGLWTMSRTRVVPTLPGAGPRSPAPLEGDEANDEPLPGSGDALPLPLDPDDVVEVPGLPGEEEARRIALDTLEATGLDTDDATVTAQNNLTSWTLDVVPRVDGVPAPGLTSSVMIGPGGRIDGASGLVGDLDELGSYPLVGTRAGIDRLNGDWSYTPPLHDTVTRDGGGPEVDVTSAELVLTSQMGWDGTTYLVPSYQVVAGDDAAGAPLTSTVPAVTDDLIDRGLDQATLAARPEREDLAEPPVLGDTRLEDSKVGAPLDACGIDDVWVGEYRFAVLEPPFDATDAPDEYTGVGGFDFDTGVYTDDSGIVVQFTEVDPEGEPPPCN
jgi:hypothetical protein